jgi:steroid delta-isomerase-like uncharacterized protein
MSEDNKQVVRRLFEEAIEGGNLALIDEVFAPDLEYADSFGRRGLDGYRDFVAGLRSALDDLHCEIERVIAEDDRVVARVKVTGTNVGELDTMTPSGRPLSFTMISILEFADGRVKRCVDARDNISVWVQVGDVPAHLRQYANGAQG